MTHDVPVLSLDQELPESLAPLAAGSELVFRHHSHAPMIVDILLGEGSGERAARRLADLVARAEAAQIRLRAELPYSTLAAPIWIEQIRFLKDRGVAALRLTACPSEAPYGPEHDSLQHFSADWRTWKRKAVHDLCRTAGIDLIDLLPD